jgi:hypothetical protein
MSSWDQVVAQKRAAQSGPQPSLRPSIQKRPSRPRRYPGAVPQVIDSMRRAVGLPDAAAKATLASLSDPGTSPTAFGPAQSRNVLDDEQAKQAQVDAAYAEDQNQIQSLYDAEDAATAATPFFSPGALDRGYAAFQPFQHVANVVMRQTRPVPQLPNPGGPAHDAGAYEAGRAQRDIARVAAGQAPARLPKRSA